MFTDYRPVQFQGICMGKVFLSIFTSNVQKIVCPVIVLYASRYLYDPTAKYPMVDLGGWPKQIC